ncbi:MAG: stage IV sporulation protein A [Deltaproteobacteria bacterium]
MDKMNIYQEIAERTNGDIYLGVVGPVRTGKSTFIKRFMDLLVIPNIQNSYSKERAKDEMPQSAAGKTIMTTEPKFIPNEAVDIVVDDNIELKVRLVDCVGYLVNGALGYLENNSPRMVSTPWFDYQVPFGEAAEIGTKKVINEHSTIGLLITTDGTITDISRNEYVEAEERVISELKAIKKPFIIVLNSAKPNAQSTLELKEELEKKHGTPVVVVDCLNLNMDDINEILERVLLEFTVIQVEVNLPRWVESLENEHWLKSAIFNSVKDVFAGTGKLREIRKASEFLSDNEYVTKVNVSRISPGIGSVEVSIDIDYGLFYRILGEASGFEIEGEHELIGLLKELGRIKTDYDKVAEALRDVRETGYGIVSPLLDELKLEEPEMIKQGSRFGVRLRASAPSIHMIRADIETEVSPIVGTERQSEELVNYLLREFEGDTSKIWESNIFGKSLNELVNEGLHNKLYRMPEDAQKKLQETLQKIINEGSGGLICIIL